MNGFKMIWLRAKLVKPMRFYNYVIPAGYEVRGQLVTNPETKDENIWFQYGDKRLMVKLDYFKQHI